MKKNDRKKKKQRKGGAQSGQTFMKLSRGLRSGSVQIKRYSKELAHRFNDYTQGKSDEKQEARFRSRLDRLFSRLHLDILRGHGFVAFLLALAILLAAMLLLMNNSDIAVDKATLAIAGLSPDFEGYTILLMSDLQGQSMGDQQAKLLSVVNQQNYDIAILAGDMVGKKGDAQPLLDLLSGMTGGKPVYFIAGDSDPGPMLDEPRALSSGTLEQFTLEDWIVQAEELGATYLDTSTAIKVGASTLWLTPASLLNVNASETLSRLGAQVTLETQEVLDGLDAAYRALPFTSYRQQCLDALSAAVKSMTDSDLHIAVAHQPPSDEFLQSAYTSSQSDSFLRAVDLVLAGHYCGGNWKLPFVGALYIPSDDLPRHGWFPARSQVEGYRLSGSTGVYVTGGLGATDAIHTPGFRLANKSKVTLITLTSAMNNHLMDPE